MAARWLAAQSVPPPEAEALVAQLLALFDHPALGGLLDGDALVEAPVAGIVGGRAIAGTVDRLLVTPERVTILDYKTSATIPPEADAVPLAIQRQMAAYRAIVAQALKPRPVDALLLYTAGPRLIALDPAALDALAAALAPADAAPMSD
jgi:ATP-dependent helicase/nuclease subunit A